MNTMDISIITKSFAVVTGVMRKANENGSLATEASDAGRPRYYCGAPTRRARADMIVAATLDAEPPRLPVELPTAFEVVQSLGGMHRVGELCDFAGSTVCIWYRREFPASRVLRLH
jgi:hypothetical protein